MTEEETNLPTVAYDGTKNGVASDVQDIVPAEPAPLTTDGLPPDIVADIADSPYGRQQALEGYQYVVSEFMQREFLTNAQAVASKFDGWSDGLRTKVLQTLHRLPCRDVFELADRLEPKLTMDEVLEARAFAKSIGL